MLWKVLFVFVCAVGCGAKRMRHRPSTIDENILHSSFSPRRQYKEKEFVTTLINDELIYGRKSPALSVRNQWNVSPITKNVYLSSNVTYESGYITWFEFQGVLSEMCDSTPSLINSIELGACFNSFLADTDDFSNSATYYTWNSPGLNSDGSILIVESYFSDASCQDSVYSPRQYSLPTVCSSASNDLSYGFYNFTGLPMDFPGSGQVLKLYNAQLCGSEVSQLTWNAQSYCHVYSYGSYLQTCVSGPTVGDYSYVYFDSFNCTGANSTYTSNSFDACTPRGQNIDSLESYSLSCYGYPATIPCLNYSEIKYTRSGQVSVLSSFVTCLQNIDGNAIMFPGYNTGDMMSLDTEMSLNNIVNIDALTNTVTLDVFFFLGWIDFRLAMPSLFSTLQSSQPQNSDLWTNGLDITDAVRNSDLWGDSPGIWLPQLVFPGKIPHFYPYHLRCPADAEAKDITNEYIKVFSNGQVFWSRHIVLSLLQSNFNYLDFPADTQLVYIRFFSVALLSNQIEFNPIDVGYMYAESSDASELNYAVTENPIWQFQNVTIMSGKAPPGTLYGSRPYAQVVMQVQRYPTGLVLRLGMPVFLLVFLAALSFWADPEERINSTVTMLLAISALYIIVFQNIPMIGYLTTFDTFVLAMFGMLFSCCVLHLFTVRLRREEKISRWPLRKFYIRVLELLGRVFVLPIITAMYLVYFSDTMSIYRRNAAIVAISTFSVGVASREVFSARSSFLQAIEELEAKFEELKNLSTFEILMLNMYKYRKFSTSIAFHMKKMAEKEKQKGTEKEAGQWDSAVPVAAVTIQNTSKSDSDDEDDAGTQVGVGAGVEMQSIRESEGRFQTTNPMRF